MDWLLRRNFWLVKLLGLVFVTALAANTTTTLLTLYLLSSSSSSSSSSPEPSDDVDTDDVTDPGQEALVATATPTNERARRAERTAERILGSNPFCPSCSPATTETPQDLQVLETGDPTTADLASARRSQLPLEVAATMEAEDPARSLATLVDTTRGIGGLYGVGDELGPDIEIVRVTAGVVHLRNGGQLEYIPFDAAPPPPPKASTEPKTKEAKTKASDSSLSIPGADEAIQCSGKGDCVVARSFVEQLIAQPKLLMGQGGASPTTTQDGSPGFRLRGVKKGTLPDLLGLKNGDVITEVGGAPLTMDVLPGLYGKLRNASHIEVTVDRRGERVSRQLEIRS